MNPDKKQRAEKARKELRYALDAPGGGEGKIKAIEAALSSAANVTGVTEIAGHASLNGRIDMAYKELGKILRAQTPKPISFAQKLQEKKQERENVGRRVDPKRRGILQAQKYKRFLKETKPAAERKTTKLEMPKETEPTAYTGVTQELTPQTTAPPETKIQEKEVPTGQAVPLKPEDVSTPQTAKTTQLPTSNDFLGPAVTINTTVRSVRPKITQKISEEPATTGVIGTSGGRVIYTAPPKPQETAELNKYQTQTQRVTDNTFESVKKGDFGLGWKVAAERNPQMVRNAIRGHYEFRYMGDLVMRNRDLSPAIASRPEVAAAIRRRDLAETELRKQNLLNDTLLEETSFRTAHEGQSGMNGSVMDTVTPVETLTDEEYVRRAIEQEAGVLYRYADNRPQEAQQLGIPQMLEGRSRPPLSTPQLPSPEDFLGIQSRAASKFTDIASKQVAGKLEANAAGQAAANAVKVAGARLTTQLGVYAARKGMVGLLAGLALKGVGALVSGGTSLILSFVPAIYKFLRRHRDDFAALGAGIFALGALAGSALIAGIGVGVLGIGLLGGATLVGIGASIIGFLALIVFPAIIIPILISMFIVVFSVAIILFIINTGGYITPYADPLAPPNLSQSEFFDVTKTASPAGPIGNNNLPVEIIYTVTIEAHDEALSNITFLNTYAITQSPLVAQAPDPALPNNAQPSSTPPTTIAANGSYTLAYTARFDESFKDSVVCDNFTVSAEADGKPGSETATACVTIGNPPDECPSGWPVDTSRGQKYFVNQGPEGSTTHRGHEAIDAQFGNVASAQLLTNDNTAIATHRGVVTVAGITDSGSLSVAIRGNCGGKTFTSWHGHNRAVLVKVGDTVARGTPIGLVGMTGYARSGPHDHYEFLSKAFPMGFPYIPVNRNNIVGCVGRPACGTDIP